jgi:hypothetical protein
LRAKTNRLVFIIIIKIDQEEINKQLQAIFGIQTGYHGSVVSTFAKVTILFK